MSAQARFTDMILATRFGRRIFLMFCLAALVPAAVVFWIAYSDFAEHTQEATENALQSGAKNHALAVFGRLQAAREALAASADVADDERDLFLARYFADAATIDLSVGDADAPRGDFSIRVGDALRGLPRTPGLLLLAPRRGGENHEIVLLEANGSAAGAVLAARLDPAYLWGEPDEIGGAMRICVHAGSRPLFCGGGEQGADDGNRRSAEWALFLKPIFGADEWIFVAESEDPDRLSHYLAFALPVVIGVVLLAFLLSSLQTRKVLVPLDALLGKIRSLGGGAAGVRKSAGADEFSVLSQTFDDMGTRIGQQLQTLRTLADIDRLILARVGLPSVIAVVVERILHIVGDASVGVVLPPPDGASTLECHLRARGAQAIEIVSLPGAPDRSAPPPPASGEGTPVPVRDIAPASLRAWLERNGDTVAHELRPVGRVEAGPRVVLGLAAPAAIADDVLAQVRDLAERIAVANAFEQHQNLLMHQARHDLLTGLPNRLATYEALTEAIASAQAAHAVFAVVFLDLDRFKAINDGLGHALGDDILIQSGMRIRDSIGADDFIGRFGGDEFFLILRSVANGEDVASAMDKVAVAFSQPITAGRREFAQRYSAGIAFFPADGEDAGSLIRNADVAMYRAKKAGGARAAFFEAKMNREAQARLQLESDLRLAIRDRRIALQYQPRVDSRDGRVVGVEALARWTHPVDGAIPPPVFIALAEECGLIDELGRLVLDEACRQIAEWAGLGLPMPLVGVNISSRQLQSGTLVADVSAALGAWNVAPQSLELEVTESMMVQDADSGVAQLKAVRDLGVKVAIDDFGTGYSSLAYLTRLPSDTLKIDRAFVSELEGGDRSVEAVVRSIIAIARDLGKVTVAEGVESTAQLRKLAGWGCHIIQGYVYSRPLPAGDITRILAAGGILPPALPDGSGHSPAVR